MKRCRGLRKPLFSVLAILLLLFVGAVPTATSDDPPDSPFYVYGFVKSDGVPVANASVYLTLSSGGGVVAWSNTSTDMEGFYTTMFQDTSFGDVVVGGVGGVEETLVVDGPSSWMNYTVDMLEYTLSPGWNLVSMGLLTTTFASDIASQMDNCLFIVNWSAEAKAYSQLYASDTGEGDFSLVDGYGYWIYMIDTDTFTLYGKEKTGPKTYALAPGGWNLIGWTDNTTTTTASELCSIVNDTYYDGVRGYITPWNTTRQEYDKGYLESSLFPPGAFPDIPITRQQGYWMWVSTATNWTPDPQPPEWSPDVRLTDVGGWGARQPDIAVSGNFVHVVWENSSDYQIWYHRSPDLGVTWEEPQQISNTPSGQLTFAPCVVANGSQVYVFWEDTRDPAVGEIYMAKSTDYGESWTNMDVRISSNDGYRSFRPYSAVWGDTVYVMWTDEYFNSIGGRAETFFSRSDDRGASWTTPVNITSNDGYASHPVSVCVYEDTVHVALADFRSGNWEAYYKRSDDRGETWSNAIPVSLIDGYNSLVSDLACDGTTLHVVWRDDIDVPGQEIYYARSTDNGDTWSTPARLSKDDDLDGGFAAISAEDGVVFASWQDDVNWTIHYRVSEDDGASWSPVRELIPLPPPVSSGQPIPLIQDGVIHVTFTDNRTGYREVYYKRSPGWV